MPEPETVAQELLALDDDALAQGDIGAIQNLLDAAGRLMESGFSETLSSSSITRASSPSAESGVSAGVAVCAAVHLLTLYRHHGFRQGADQVASDMVRLAAVVTEPLRWPSALALMQLGQMFAGSQQHDAAGIVYAQVHRYMCARTEENPEMVAWFDTYARAMEGREVRGGPAALRTGGPAIAEFRFARQPQCRHGLSQSGRVVLTDRS